MKARKSLVAASVALALAVPAWAGTSTGPSSSAAPYYLNVPAHVDVMSVFTVGDSVNDKPDSLEPYRMVGIPDGMGAYDNGDGTFTLLMSHELRDSAGVVREHGFAGAFVSKWIIRTSDMAVLHVGDEMKKVYQRDSSTGKYVPLAGALGRFCSADLPARSAFYNAKTGKGYSGRIFMNGEENGAAGRAFAHVVTGPGSGISYELPALGTASWENVLASAYEQDKTVVAGTDDSGGGRIYLYVGEKQSVGNEVEKAGLTNGTSYSVKVDGVATEDRGTGIPHARFTLEARASGTGFQRPEDGAWDTRNPKLFYFVTTDRFDSVKAPGTPAGQVGRSRLYRLTFDSIRRPEDGGCIDMLIDGTGPAQMMDNITVDGDGNLIIQEDPGGQVYLARIWKYYPKTGKLVEIAKADPARFGSPTTQDEESSAVLEITELLESQHSRHHRHDRRYYLGTVQAHSYDKDAELVEDGQLFLLAVPRHQR